MEVSWADRIASYIDQYASNSTGVFDIEDVNYDSPLREFHHWTKDRSARGAFLVRHRVDEIARWLLLIEWNSKYGYYVVVYPEERSGPLAEIHQLKNVAGIPTLVWKYKPKKRDGQNERRKEYFKRYSLSTEVRISCPQSAADVDAFLSEVFLLVECWEKADNLDENAPPEPRKHVQEEKPVETLKSQFDDGPSFYPEEAGVDATRREGAFRQIFVYAYERDPKLRRQCIETHGTKCCICGISFGEEYGPNAEGYIHVHHLQPLSEIGKEHNVNPVEDMRPVCPNCHAVVHLGGGCRKLEDVRDLRLQQGRSVAQHCRRQTD